MKKAMIFIDANNWYHNIKHWFKPSDIDITKVAELISKEKKLDIKEIRWYVSMPNIEDNELIYKRQRSFLGHLQKQGVKIITRKLQKLSNKELKKKRQELLESWDLCSVCKKIVEPSLLDIKDSNQKEKGIDVWIAIDMVKEAIRNNLDCCILISGDADFVPAFALIKDAEKEVLSAFIPRGYSNELRQKFDYFIFEREDLAKCLKEYKKEQE
ncbi:MAG: NYN domain-containing protein [Candidatus Pacearchaeota archaeon]|nr:NYN domain-containing protein [Candidatus Pacearchaeota archaeon]